MRAGGWRWIVAVTEGEVAPTDSTADGQENGISDGSGNGGWVLGQRWKDARDVPPGSSDMPAGGAGYDETGVDETLARCWLVVHSVAAGWGQRDLLDDLENMFR
jgi:hypothetical protein